MVAYVDVRPVGTELVDAVIGELVYAGAFDHVKEDAAGDELLEIHVVVDLSQEHGEHALGVEGLPLVDHAVVARKDVREIVQELRILHETAHCILEILTLVRPYVPEIIFLHMRSPSQ